MKTVLAIKSGSLPTMSIKNPVNDILFKYEFNKRENNLFYLRHDNVNN